MKKIAVNTVKTFLKENKHSDTFTAPFNVGDSSFEVVFHTVLSIEEKTTFIHRVISGCFDITGKYRPEYVTPMIRATVLQMCTNIPAMTLKSETDNAGAPALDLDAMNELYLVLDLDNLQNSNYQKMLADMCLLCDQAINWQRDYNLSSQGTDSSIHRVLEALAEKIENIDMGELMQYAGTLAESTKGLGEGGILKGLLAAKDS